MSSTAHPIQPDRLSLDAERHQSNLNLNSLLAIHLGIFNYISPNLYVSCNSSFNDPDSFGKQVEVEFGFFLT